MVAALTVWTGELEVPATPTVWTGTTEAAASSAVMPAGYPSVAAMLDAAPFYIAHRGGSRDWPEMTARAYTEAVARGVGALEVSLARTTDGVWFGAHDQYLDRVALGTAGTTLHPPDMTWAQVQELAVLGSTAAAHPDQPAQPFMTFEDLAAAYGPTHVLFVDPKHAEHHREEFFDLLATIPSSRHRVVVKYFGPNASLGVAAKDEGYTTWGYYYQAQIDNGVFAATQHAWDLLGMEFASPAYCWDAIHATGKPSIAHICATLSAATIGLSNGATGIMAAGVRAIVQDQGL